MNIELEIVDTSAYNCYCTSLATLAHYFGMDYQMISYGVWGFDFDESKPTLGQKISNPHRVDPKESAKIFHGLSIEVQEQGNDFVEVVRQNISMNRPFIINSDSYWCPWSMAYQKRQFLHSFLITGIDDATGNLICRDPYITTDVISVKYETIKPGIRNFGILTVNPVCLCIYDLYRALYNDMNYLLNESESTVFKNITLFAENITTIDFPTEMNGYNDSLYAVPLFDRLKSIMISRRGYSYLLHYIGKKANNEQLISLHKELYKVSKLWEEIRCRIIRLCLKPSDKNKLLEVADDILKIASVENSIAVNIKNAI